MFGATVTMCQHFTFIGVKPHAEQTCETCICQSLKKRHKKCKIVLPGAPSNDSLGEDSLDVLVQNKPGEVQWVHPLGSLQVQPTG